MFARTPGGGLAGAAEFLETLEKERVCFIAGHFGSFKTAFSVYLGLHFGRLGYHFVAPFKCVLNAWPIPKFRNPSDGVGAIIVLDEGGLWWRTRKTVDEFAAYCRKLDIYVLIPSKTEPHPSLQALILQFTGGWRDLGVQVLQGSWWHSHGGQASGGRFDWYRPQQVWGLYDSTDPATDEYMAEIIASWTSQMKQWHRRRGSGPRDFSSESHGTPQAIEEQRARERQASWEAQENKRKKKERRHHDR